MTSIAIVGSGFAGFTCARRLSRILARHHAQVDITLISPVDYMLYTPLLPDVAGAVVDARFVTVPLANMLNGADHHDGPTRRPNRWGYRGDRRAVDPGARVAH